MTTPHQGRSGTALGNGGPFPVAGWHHSIRLPDAIRNGSPVADAPFEIQTASMGAPTVLLDRALQLATGLEDEELIRRTPAGE